MDIFQLKFHSWDLDTILFLKNLPDIKNKNAQFNIYHSDKKNRKEKGRHIRLIDPTFERNFNFAE